ncbi:MAG: diguanylate cyclase [Gammaproteobacteria bacterium]|nr:diguanylate cyclase [Gammaproteobacteria bacterium]
MTDDPDYHDKLRGLHQEYAVKLPKKISQIISTWERLNRHPALDDLHQLKYAVHELSGSTAIFGFNAVSGITRQLDACLDGYDERPPFFNHQQLMMIDHFIEQLKSAAERPSQAPSSGRYSSVSAAEGDTRVVIIKDNSKLDENLAHDLSHYGYKIEILDALPKLLQRASQVSINLIVLIEPDETELQQLQLHQQQTMQTIPLVCISSKDDFNHRLQAVRAGAYAYFVKPVDLFQLSECINELTSESDLHSYRIMVVDDDLCSVHHTATMLEMAGIETHVVTQPETILEHLNEFQPELILMDLYMPSCNGIELASIIRQQPTYSGTSIVFYSVETAIHRHIEAIHAGGDDFLIKPMDGEHLMADLVARVQRARSNRSTMMRDSLTGLLSHSVFHDQLGRELARCQRHQGTLSYVLIDLDHFKQVNDKHGHGIGDRILRTLSRLLEKRLRHNDLIGRYGGDEFALILQDVDLKAAQIIVDDVRHSFGLLAHNNDQQPLHITFSAGIATYPRQQSLASLCNSADKALHEAKRQGRNRVVAFHQPVDYVNPH